MLRGTGQPRVGPEEESSCSLLVSADGGLQCREDATTGAGARSLQHRVPYGSACCDYCYACTALLEPEHQQRAAGVAHAGVVGERADRAECRGRVLRADAEGHAGPGPAADAREHGDVLLAVRPEIAHRIADYARRALEATQLERELGKKQRLPSYSRVVEYQSDSCV